MADNANKQYSDQSQQLGFHGDYTSTGAQGSDTGGSDPYAAYSNGEVGGAHLDGHDLSNTGAPGSAPHQPPADGSSATVTDGHWSGIPDGTVSGSTSTSKSALVDPFSHQGVTDTGAGDGTPTHTDAGGADQSSPWKNV